jgi:hypothetical protein
LENKRYVGFYTVDKEEDFWVPKLEAILEGNLPVGQSPLLRIYDAG